MTLATSPLEELRTYVLGITGVRDRAGRPIAPGATARVSCVNDLLCWMPLDEGRGATLADRVTGKTLSVRGTVDRQTHQGRAGLAFDGATTHVELGNMIPLEGGFTYAVWVHLAADLGQGCPLDGTPIHRSQAYARLGHPYNPVATLLGANHGNAEGTTAFHFQGLMRDLRIYGRALCSAELHRIMGQTR